MDRYSIIQDILYIESKQQIFSYRVSGIPLWLLIRQDVIWSSVKQKLGLEEPHVRVPLKSLSLCKIIRYIALSLMRNPCGLPSRDVVVFGYAVNNIKEENGYLNRLYHYMWKEGASIIEVSHKYEFFEPKYENVCYEDLIPITSKVLRQLYFLDRHARSAINEFINYMQKALPSIDARRYTQMLVNLVKKIRVESVIYEILLRKKCPKLIIVEDAHYFGRIHLTTTAKKLGIKVAEYQHGYIGYDHFAYNFSPETSVLLEPYLPDYFLTWGKYWSRSVNTPSKKIEIGHFYLWDKSRNIHKDTNQTSKIKNIVVVSGGTMPGEYVKLCLYLKRLDGRCNFIFRPHPSEIPHVNIRYSEIIKAGYSIDTSNLYSDLLPKADVVISLEKTTVLYEALLFTKKVFLVSDTYNEEVPFIVTNMGSIINDIENKEVDNAQVRDIWEPDPLSKYRAFLYSEIGI